MTNLQLFLVSLVDIFPIFSHYLLIIRSFFGHESLTFVYHLLTNLNIYIIIFFELFSNS